MGIPVHAERVENLTNELSKVQVCVVGGVIPNQNQCQSSLVLVWLELGWAVTIHVVDVNVDKLSVLPGLLSCVVNDI